MVEYDRSLIQLAESRQEREAALGSAAWTIFAAIGLASLLLYLLIRQAIQPGFTDYWGFMVAQVAVTLVFVVAMSSVFASEGGLSWYTHLVVTGNTWADTLGTAGHLYERHVTYDKITHFLAGVALTAAAADVLRAMNRRGWIRLVLGRQLALAVAVALLANIGWEIYEYVGDVVFQSERHRGALDTAYDFVSDLGGALVSALIIWILRAEATARGDPVHRTA
jgi:uncharacterized membrane protein YjdF